MFEEFYGFTSAPFSRAIPVSALFKDFDRNEHVERLKYAAKNQLFAILCGESGVGKTTILRRLSDELANTEYIVIYISDSKLTPRHFYKAILEQLGYEAKYFRGDAKTQLHKEIEIMKAVHNLNPVVIVDESHLLDRVMLEEIRFLLNLKMDSQSPVSLILSGQSELRANLRLHSYAAIRQRVDIQCQVGTLDMSQTTEYIRTHLSFVGCTNSIFSDAALETIFKFSCGILRIINKVCICSLIFGAQNRKQIIDDHMVNLVIEAELA